MCVQSTYIEACSTQMNKWIYNCMYELNMWMYECVYTSHSYRIQSTYEHVDTRIFRFIHPQIHLSTY